MLPTIHQLIGSNVLIIGCPASGKTTLANSFKDYDSHKIVHSDDYMNHGYKDSMYVIMSEIQRVHKHSNTIVEGIQGYRLLRKGVELDCYYPDVVIELKISEDRMIKTYRNERLGKSIESLVNFNKMHDKILKDYRMMRNKKPPHWITVNNEY